MKKNTKPTDRKRTFAICGLSALCVAVLAGAWFLTREPETEFIPASTERADVTDTWEENSGTDASLLMPQQRKAASCRAQPLTIPRR